MMMMMRSIMLMNMILEIMIVLNIISFCLSCSLIVYLLFVCTSLDYRCKEKCASMQHVLSVHPIKTRCMLLAYYGARSSSPTT